MRQLYALILGTGLCVPSLALAATPSDLGQRPAAKAVAAQTVASQRAESQPAAKSQDASSKQSDRSRYAAKEEQSGDAKDYRGGDSIVIGASAATAILAVLLILVLI